MRFSHMSWAKKSSLNKEPSISQRSDISCICHATDSHQAKPWKCLLPIFPVMQARSYLLVRYKSRSSCNRHERCQGILNYSRITYIFNEDTHDFINLLYRVVHPNPPSPAVRCTTSIEVLIHSFHASRYTGRNIGLQRYLNHRTPSPSSVTDTSTPWAARTWSGRSNAWPFSASSIARLAKSFISPMPNTSSEENTFSLQCSLPRSKAPPYCHSTPTIEGLFNTSSCASVLATELLDKKNHLNYISQPCWDPAMTPVFSGLSSHRDRKGF